MTYGPLPKKLPIKTTLLYLFFNRKSRIALKYEFLQGVCVKSSPLKFSLGQPPKLDITISTPSLVDFILVLTLLGGSSPSNFLTSFLDNSVPIDEAII